jgi:hypothetical protein
MPLIYSRPDKLNHADTVLYEIDMLRFAAGRMVESDWRESRDAWVYLESFLVHYRNLISFLGSENPRVTDLHVATIWQLTNLAPPTEIAKIHITGKQLWQKYEPRDAQGGGRISQYLQHCTTKRIDFKNWEIDTMISDIEPVLVEIEKCLRSSAANRIVRAVPPVQVLEPLSASTTVATITASALPDFDASAKKQFS